MRIITSIAVLCASLLMACGQSAEQSTGSSTTSGASATGESPSWILASAPREAMDVGVAKAEVEEGQQVTVRGRIGGRVDPMSSERAQFVIMDPAIPSCADMGDADHCPTPWDYCCESPASMQANSATVVIVDEEDNARKIDLHTLGFEPLDEVVVVGTVDSRPTPEVLVIRAREIYKAGS